MTDLDKIDRKILSILQGDGRIANVELAERIGLSPTSIGERLKRLQRDGFVEGYGARLNPHRLGLGLLVFVEVLLDKTTPDVFERFARAVQNAPEVLECHMVAGGFDYLVKARVCRHDGLSAVPRRAPAGAAGSERDPDLRRDGRGQARRAAAGRLRVRTSCAERHAACVSDMCTRAALGAADFEVGLSPAFKARFLVEA